MEAHHAYFTLPASPPQLAPFALLPALPLPTPLSRPTLYAVNSATQPPPSGMSGYIACSCV